MSNNFYFPFPSNQHVIAKITFRLWAYIISGLAFLSVCFALGIALAVDVHEAIIGMLGLLLIPPIFIMIIFYMLFLHAVWKQIPPNIARTTPGKAVGFMFIPFFNIYWQFVALYGLGQDLNQTLKQAGLRPQVKETFGLICCITSPMGSIPRIGAFITIAGSIFGVVYLFSLKNGVVKLLTIQQHQDRQQQLDDSRYFME
jgi:hypothetical protein